MAGIGRLRVHRNRWRRGHGLGAILSRRRDRLVTGFYLSLIRGRVASGRGLSHKLLGHFQPRVSPSKNVVTYF